MGFMHSIYGVGALIAPLLATYFAEHYPDRFFMHYSVSTSLALFQTAAVALTFRLKPIDELVPPRVQSSNEDKGIELGKADEEATDEAPPPATMATIFRTPMIQLMGLFLLVYIGLEVTMSGWIVTYLEVMRDSGPKAGYVSSGFFGGQSMVVAKGWLTIAEQLFFALRPGLTAGRLLLLPVTAKLGDELAVYV